MGPLETTATSNASHVHTWAIAEANGPISAGVCRTCSQVREFRNWLPSLDFTSRAEREFESGSAGL
jgi:hypothetical protein